MCACASFCVCVCVCVCVVAVERIARASPIGNVKAVSVLGMVIRVVCVVFCFVFVNMCVCIVGWLRVACVYVCV